MNTHKNARLTYLRRLEMVQDMTLRGVSAAQAGLAAGVSAVTARKWLGRYLVDGPAGLLDKSSRPAKSPGAIDPGGALAIVELRRKLFLQTRIATYMGVSKATVSRVLRRAGLSRLSDLQSDVPVQRYEREAPGELLRIDIKKLGRFDKIGHRITGDRSQRARNIGWEYVFVAIDDHSRIAFSQMYPDEKKESAEHFLRAVTGYFAGLRIPIQRVIRTTARRSTPQPSVRPAWSWAPRRSSRARTARRPMARPSASSSPRCGSGPTDVPTQPRRNAAPHCPAGSTSATGIANITASDACRPCLASRCLAITS